MQIDQQTYDWLVSLQLLVHSDAAPPKISAKGQVTITDHDIERTIMAGVMHKHLLKRLCELNPEAPGVKQSLSDLNKVVDSTTEPSKFANWTKLADIFPVFPGFALTKSTIDDIMKGVTTAAVGVISQIQAVCQYKGRSILIDKSNIALSGVNAKNKEEADKSKTRLDISNMYPAAVTQQVSRLTQESGFGECANCLEFFCLAISKATVIKPMQAVPLFNDNHKNWAALITKGVQDDTKPVISFFKQAISNSTVLNHLVKIEQDKGGVDFALEALKPGLLSKDLRVASLACTAISGVMKNLVERGAGSFSWAFFTKLYGGCLALVTCVDTFGDNILADVYLILEQIGKVSLLKMFKEEFRKMLPDPIAYAKFIGHLVTLYYSDSRLIQTMMKEGVVDYLITFSLDGLKHPNPRQKDESITTMATLLCRHLVSLPSYFVSRPELFDSILEALGTECYASPLALVTILTQLASIIPVLSKTKSPFAASVFKLMMEIFKASFTSLSLRTYACETLSKILMEIPALPADSIATALLHWMVEQEDDEDMDLISFALLAQCTDHATIDTEAAETIIDLLAKIIPKSRYYPVIWCQLLRKAYERNPQDLSSQTCQRIADFLADLYKLVAEHRQQSTGKVVLENSNSQDVRVAKFVLHQACHQVLSSSKARDSPLHQMALPVLLMAESRLTTLEGKHPKGIKVLLRLCCQDPDRAIAEFSKTSRPGSVDILQFKQEIADLSLTVSRVEGQVKAKPKQNQPSIKQLQTDEKPSVDISPLVTPKQSKRKPNKKIEDEWSSKKEHSFGNSLHERAKSEKEIPHYMKGTEVDPKNRKLKYEILMQIKKEEEEAKEKAKKIKFEQRKYELKSLLVTRSGASGPASKMKTHESESTTLPPISAKNKEFSTSIDFSKQKEKEDKRKLRHQEIKKKVEERRKEIMAKMPSEAEVALQEKQKEMIEEKKKKNKVFLRQKKLEIDSVLKKAEFLNMLREQFEISRAAVKKGVADKRINKVKDAFQKVRDKINSEKVEHEKILNLLHSEGMKIMLRENKKSTDTIFEFFASIDNESKDNGFMFDGKRMQARSFFEFLNMFGFLPAVVTQDEAQLMYRDTTKGQTLKWTDKNKIKHELPFPIDIHQFEELLLRIAVKKKDIFIKQAFDNRPDDVKVKQQCQTEFKDFNNDKFYNADIKKKLDEAKDTYNTADFHYSNFDGLINYLRMPIEKIAMEQKLKFMRRDYLYRLKPQTLKKRPKSVLFSRLSKNNEPVRQQKIEDALGNMFSSLSVSHLAADRASSAKHQRDELLADSKLKAAKSATKLKPLEVSVSHHREPEIEEPSVDFKTIKEAKIADDKAKKSKKSGFAPDDTDNLDKEDSLKKKPKTKKTK